MIDEERELSNKIKGILDSSISSDKSIYYRVMNNYELEKSKGKKKYPFIFKLLVPVSLALLIVTSSIFPVFGSNGSLVDVYNSYRVNKEISGIQLNSNNQSDNKNNTELLQVELKSLIEKEFNVDPSVVNKLYVQELDEREIVTIVVCSKISKRDPIEVINMRKKIGWGRYLRQNQIDPSTVINGLRNVKSKLNQNVKHVILRGTIEAFSGGTLILDNFPFKIYLTNSTIVENPLAEEKQYEIEADYNSANNLLQATKISELNLSLIGIKSFLGQIVGIYYNNSFFVKINDGSVKQIFCIPRTRFYPSYNIISLGNIIRIDGVSKNVSQFVALGIFQPRIIFQH